MKIEGVKYNTRKWRIKRECNEYIVRFRGQRRIAFVARSIWALKIGLQNCKKASRPWRGQREKSH